MILTILTFIVAFLLEGLGSYISVIGIAKTFNHDPVMIVFAIMLDLAKILVVSLLYKYHKELPKLLKYYFYPAALVTMMITTYGAAGYLSDNFRAATFKRDSALIALNAIEQEKTKLEIRKVEIDKQVANLPPEYAKARLKLMAGFKEETTRINSRLVELDLKVPEL